MKPQRSVFKTVVAPIIVAIALVPTVAIAVWEVAHGRGAATYSNVYGLAIHYTSILIFLFAVFLAAIAAYVARVVYFWREGRVGAIDIRKISATRSPGDSADGK
jgi:uncharacterized oligopeptide transporter (OPT) family protein